jgi:hypothetical protein
MPTPPDVAVALLGVGLAVAGAALVGSVGARMSAGQPPLRLWTEGPAGTMRAVLPMLAIIKGKVAFYPLSFNGQVIMTEL